MDEKSDVEGVHLAGGDDAAEDFEASTDGFPRQERWVCRAGHFAPIVQDTTLCVSWASAATKRWLSSLVSLNESRVH